MKKKYKKLKGFSSFAYQKLYLGEDHLLVSDGYMVEQYKRLYFADIELIALSRTSTFALINAVFGVGLVLGLILVAGFQDNPEAAWTLGIFFLGMPFLVLLINLIKGPSCMLEITTGVQQLKIRCVSRERKARSILKRTVPMISQAQGRQAPLSTEELQPRSEAPEAAT
ncbi:MAG: hypothetical protein AB3N63_17055 [Puniceicoccaceae bacterium]